MLCNYRCYYNAFGYNRCNFFAIVVCYRLTLVVSNNSCYYLCNRLTLIICNGLTFVICNSLSSRYNFGNY